MSLLTAFGIGSRNSSPRYCANLWFDWLNTENIITETKALIDDASRALVSDPVSTEPSPIMNIGPQDVIGATEYMATLNAATISSQGFLNACTQQEG